MKKILIALLPLALMYSCTKEKKESLAKPKSPTPAGWEAFAKSIDSSLMETDTVDVNNITFVYYLDGVQSTLPSVIDETIFPVFSAVKNTSTQSAVITIHGFSSEANHIAWGDAQGLNFSILKQFEDDVSTEAALLGVNDQTTYDSNLDNYVQNYPWVGLSPLPQMLLVFDDIVPSGTNTVLPLSTTPFLIGWNNRIGCIQNWAIYSYLVIYDKTFYRTKMATFRIWGFNTISLSGFFGLSYCNNKTSSYIHF